VCCTAIDKSAEQAAELCHEMLSSSLHRGSDGAQGAGGGRGDDLDELQRGHSALGGIARSPDASSDGAGRQFLESGMLGGRSSQGPGALGGRGSGAAGVGAGVKRVKPVAAQLPSDAAGGGWYSSVYELIHVSMPVWVGAAILVVAATLLLVKRCLPSSPSPLSPRPLVPSSGRKCAWLRGCWQPSSMPYSESRPAPCPARPVRASEAT
jgi:hypothetical protein